MPKDESHNPYSQEYINPGLRQYLRESTCQVCGRFKKLCECQKKDEECEISGDIVEVPGFKRTHRRKKD